VSHRLNVWKELVLRRLGFRLLGRGSPEMSSTPAFWLSRMRMSQPTLLQLGAWRSIPAARAWAPTSWTTRWMSWIRGRAP